MQTIKLISISGGKPAMAVPLVFVILVSMIKDAYEDYKKGKQDSKENNTPAKVMVGGRIETRTWAQIKPGDIIQIDRNEFVPADLAVLYSSGDKGQFFIETKSLDGETNLKIKAVATDLIE